MALIQEHKVPVEARQKLSRALLQKGWQSFWGPHRQCGYGEVTLVHRDFSVGLFPDNGPLLSIALKTSSGSLLRVGNVYSPTCQHAVDDRSDFLDHVHNWICQAGDWIIGGDFNHSLACDSPFPGTFLIPSQGTWRRSVRHDGGHAIDGFAISTSYLPSARVVGLHSWSRTQRCPIILSLADNLQACDRLFWQKPRLNLQSEVSPALEQLFLDALKTKSSDEAWAIWINLAFGLDDFPSRYKIAKPSVLKGPPQDREICCVG